MKLTKEDVEMLRQGLKEISGHTGLAQAHGCLISDNVGKVFDVVYTLIAEAEEQDND